MNNYRLLNIINPQFVYDIDCGIEKNNKKFMVIIPGFVGYDRNVACSIYLTISEKLLDESTNDGLERLINDMQEDLSILLRGYDDFVPGVDYFLSESLYDYVKTECDYESSSDSSSIDDSSDDPVEPDDSDSSDDDTYCYDLSGIVILHGKDVNRIININRYNIKRVSEILDLERKEIANRRKVLIMAKSFELSDDNVGNLIDINDDGIIDDSELDIIDDELFTRLVMKDYVLYDTSLNFTQDTDSYRYLYDMNNKDMRNLEWFYNMNNYQEYEFSREELCNIPKTFFTIINDNAIVQNPETVKNQIYDKIVKYYANGGWDDASINLNLILNSSVPTTLTSTKLNCGCADNNNGDGLGDGTMNGLTSCLDLYKNAILEWLKKMLGDDEFYKDWFFTIVTGACPEPNATMIDPLINLLTEYVENNLGGPNGNRFNPNRRYDIYDHMNCCDRSINDNEYYNIILHYIEVLKAVKNNEIDENRNMIKIYGEEFAGILPYLTC